MNAADIPTDPSLFASSDTAHLPLPFRHFQASDLFGAAREIGIVHAGELYRLRVTRAGKLILTK